MDSNNSNGSRAARERGFVALFAVLAMGLGVLASPAAAAPFAYVTNAGNLPGLPWTVSVIDTATNTVVGTPITVGIDPVGVAVTPDGKHVYVANNTPTGRGAVSVIDTVTTTVVATVPVGLNPAWVAITPDGKHAYVTVQSSGTVSVIDTGTNMVVATVGVGNGARNEAVAPDGKHVYVTVGDGNSVGTVSVIATASNTVVATVPVGSLPEGVAVTLDGAHAYVANLESNNVSVIDTVSNKVVATVPVGNPIGVAVTPDGKQAYVTSGAFPGTVSVIDTGMNKVVATVPVGLYPFCVGIVPPPPGVPFLAFNAVLNIDFGTEPNTDAFTLATSFTLSSTAPAFNPLTDPVTFQIGTFDVTIPSGSFHKNHQGDFVFSGVINSVTLKAAIKSTGTLRYSFQAGAQNASLTGTQNTVYVTLAIGGGSFSNSNSGATSVTAQIFH